MFGGFPGMGPAAARKPVDNSKFYTTLGVPKDAPPQQIKKAFRKLAMQHHPDKGGDPTRFTEMQNAYEVLSDPEKRQLYDQFGERGGGGGGGPSDIFSELFGGGGRRRGSARQRRKGQDVGFALKVTLEDLFNGTTKRLRITRKVICKACDGRGGRGSADTTCPGCQGRGVKVTVRRLGPGMIQQMQSHCDRCNGEGTVIADRDKCTTCRGNKVLEEKKTLEVFVNRGMRHGEHIVFKNAADEYPDTIPGDVVVTLHQREHATYKREGSHLFVKKNISLVQALTGFQFPLHHLDERVLLIRSEPNVIYKPGDVKVVRQEGMPQPKNAFVTGNMYIEFVVDFPDVLAPNVKQLLTRVLPNDSSEMDSLPAQYEEHVLEGVDMARERAQFQEELRSSNAYDEDSGQPRGHGPAGCRTA